jgi:hypothetical protein
MTTDMPPQYSQLQEMDPTDPFLTDFAQLQTDTNNYDTAIAQQQQAQAAYQAQYEAIQGLSGEELLYALFYLFTTQASEEQEASLNVSAAALTVQGDLTQCSNDIEAQTVSGSSDPNTVTEVALEEDCMLSVLKPGAAGAPSWAASLQGAIGTQASSALADSYSDARSEIYLEGDDQWNPTPGTTYYFNPNASTDPTSPNYDPNHMSTFQEMENNMSNPGDVDQATEASTQMTDDFNAITSTTQTLQATANEEITQQANDMKLLQSFDTKLAQEFTGIITTATNNQRTGGG